MNNNAAEIGLLGVTTLVVVQPFHPAAIQEVASKDSTLCVSNSLVASNAACRGKNPAGMDQSSTTVVGPDRVRHRLQQVAAISLVDGEQATGKM
mmetsp:Transcript_22134/g.34711  ORF Transcript_22134/g.34711 Transcript_22134/m.34711 type:complete len:94 (+) Transcript_22134:1376-1657(+)